LTSYLNQVVLAEIGPHRTTRPNDDDSRPPNAQIGITVRE
jgi:hypothetical protein